MGHLQDTQSQACQHQLPVGVSQRGQNVHEGPEEYSTRQEQAAVGLLPISQRTECYTHQREHDDENGPSQNLILNASA